MPKMGNKQAAAAASAKRPKIVAIDADVEQVDFFRKFGSPILSAAKVLSLVAALLSLLTLQSALIDRFGTAQGSFRLLMTRLTGSAVYAAVLIIAVWMLRRPLTISANGIEEELTAP